MNDFFQGPISFKAQALSITASLILLFIIIQLIKKNRLRSGYSILWFIISGAILMLSVFSNLLFIFSKLTGIFYPPAALFSILIVGLILIEIHVSTILTSHERKIKKLAQKISMLEQKLNRLLKNKK